MNLSNMTNVHDMVFENIPKSLAWTGTAKLSTYRV